MTMTRRFYGRVAGIAAIMLTVALWLGWHGTEPYCEGKPLSQWIIAMKGGPDRQKARAVVHRIGTNSIPLLLDWLRRDDDVGPKFTWRFLKYRVDAWLQRRGIVAPRRLDYPLSGAPSYRGLAWQAFVEMGPDAEASIPALVQMLADRRRQYSEFSELASAASMILPRMAPKSVGPVTCALSSPDAQVRMLACGIVGQIGADARSAIPALRLLREDQDPLTRISACLSLERLGDDPREFVPAVVKSLSHWENNASELQLDLLARHPAEAKGAVPLLVGMLTNGQSSVYMRREILSALRDIDPEAAARAGLN